MTDVLQLLTALNAKVDNLGKHGLSDKKWLSFAELALYLDVSIETVYALNKAREFTLYQRSGKMKYVKREEVDGWLELGGVKRMSKYEQSKKLRKAA
jgi:excisionase family DNA binding protein